MEFKFNLDKVVADSEEGSHVVCQVFDGQNDYLVINDYKPPKHDTLESSQRLFDLLKHERYSRIMTDVIDITHHGDFSEGALNAGYEIAEMVTTDMGYVYKFHLNTERLPQKKEEPELVSVN